MDIPPIARWILQGVFVFAALILTISLTLLAANFVHKRRAEGILKDIRTLRAVQSTTADVQRIMNRHGGGPSQAYASFCDPADGAYSVGTASQTISWLDRSVPVLRRFGLRQWDAQATVILRGGRVCYLNYSVSMEDPEDEWLWRVESSLLPDAHSDSSIYADEHWGYKVGIRDYKGVRALRSKLTLEATEDERYKAFAFDFSCVTRFRGCRQPCEIAPLLWQDVYQLSLKSVFIIPVEEATDPHCKFAEKTP
jgi:hypothetical protein